MLCPWVGVLPHLTWLTLLDSEIEVRLEPRTPVARIPSFPLRSLLTFLPLIISFNSLLCTRLLSRVLHNHSLQPLRIPILHVHRLHVTVQLLLRTLLVVALAGDADTEPERNAFDATLPDALVELGVEAYVVGAHGEGGELADLFDGAGGALFEGYAEGLWGTGC